MGFSIRSFELEGITCAYPHSFRKHKAYRNLTIQVS